MNPKEIVAFFELNDMFEKTLTLERGDYLKKCGSADTNIYYIEQGSLYVFIMDEDEERIIRFGYKGNIIVSLDSFLTEKTSDFYIQAIKKTVVKIVSKKTFNHFIQKDEKHHLIWINILENLVLQQVDREKDLLIQSPTQRYKRVFKRSPQLFQEIPNKYIASYLRMSPETLSRLKKC